MTHVVAFRARGGQDWEVTNDSKAQRFTSKGGRGQVLCMMQEKGLAAHQDKSEQSMEYMNSGEMQPCPEAEDSIAMIKASDTHLNHHRVEDSEGMDGSKSKQIIRKQMRAVWWQPERGVGGFCRISF